MRPSRSRDADTRLPAVGRLLGIDRDRMQPLNPTVHIVLADCAESVAVERAIWELAHRLPRPRFDVRAWLASDPAKDAFAAALEERGVPVDRMPTPGATWSWRGMFDAWIKLRRVRPALLHVHHAWPTSEGVSAALCETAGVRHRIVSVHGPSAPHEMQPVSRKALDQADVVTTVCGTYAEQLVSEGGVDRERVRYVPAGADPPSEEAERTVARAIRDRFGTGPNRPLFVYAGRLEPYRGAAVFVEALGLLRQRSLPFVAAIVGEGTDRVLLEARANELALATSIHFERDADDLGPFLFAADVVVVPSLWEGQSSVLTQALVRGRPVIASAVGGAPDLIEDGANGRLVPPGDAGALADALESFHRRADAAQRLGHEAARRAHEELTWSRVVEAYETVYDEMLGLASFAPESAVARGRW
jgi:glycosyltransferase involved in cell wall biosynthesis